MVGNMSMLIVNLICCLYLCCKKHFPRCEFLILYLLNLVWLVSLLISSFINLRNKIDCMPYQMALLFVIISSIKNELELIFIMILPIAFTNRQLTQCTNFIFAIFFILLAKRSLACKSTNIQLLILIAVIIFVFMFISFVINYMGLLKNYIIVIGRARLFFFLIQIIIFTITWILLF